MRDILIFRCMNAWNECAFSQRVGVDWFNACFLIEENKCFQMHKSFLVE